MWYTLRGMNEDHPKEGGSVLKYVTLQDNIVHDVGGHINDENLQDYCCTNNF